MSNVLTIIDSGNTLEITYSDGKVVYVYKDSCKIVVPASGNILYITDINKQTYTLDTALVTNPASANIAALANSLQSLLDTIPIAPDVAAALAQKAPLASPAFTGNPTAPTQTQGNSSTRLATTEFVASALSYVSLTKAALATLLTGGAAAKGQLYKITDACSSYGVVYIRAVEVNRLDESGLLVKDSVGYAIQYTVDKGDASDEIVGLIDSKYGNVFSKIIASAKSDISNLPLNDSDIQNNQLKDCEFAITDGCVFKNVLQHPNSVSDIDGNSIIDGLEIAPGGAITMDNASEITNCRIGASGVSFDNASNLEKCSIGDGLTVFFDTDTYSNKQIDKTESTFNLELNISDTDIYSVADKQITIPTNKDFCGIYALTSDAWVDENPVQENEVVEKGGLFYRSLINDNIQNDPADVNKRITISNIVPQSPSVSILEFGVNRITVIGDETESLSGVSSIVVSGSTNNDGAYTITSVVVDGGNTNVFVSESINIEDPGSGDADWIEFVNFSPGDSVEGTNTGATGTINRVNGMSINITVTGGDWTGETDIENTTTGATADVDSIVDVWEFANADTANDGKLDIAAVLGLTFGHPVKFLLAGDGEFNFRTGGNISLEVNDAAISGNDFAEFDVVSGNLYEKNIKSYV